MNIPASPINLRLWVNQTVAKVFETMLSLQVSPAENAGSLDSHARVSGSIGLAGDRVTGAVYLHSTEAFARHLTATLLGMSVNDLSGNREVNDVVGELCNVIAGSLKSMLCDQGLSCAMSTPAVIRGHAFEIEASPNLQVDRFSFDSAGHRITVETHLKLS